MAAVMGALEDEDERAPVGAEALQPQAVFVGTPGPDVIRGTAEDDTIDGLAGNDRLFGLGGNDVIRGGRGDDIIRGGQGNDELYGGPGRDTIFGNAGNDVIYGGPGDDVLNGGAGRDQLFGENGNDVLRGGGGADLLDGGRGFNTLTGGAGPDTFRFSVPGGPADRITDFEVGVDKLDLRPILPDFQAGVDALRRFVRFESVENGTLINVRPSGEGEFTVLAGLEGVQVNRLPLADLGLAAGVVTEPIIASTNAAGALGNGTSFVPSLSADGSLVAFASSSTNFVADDDGTFDIFVKDLASGEITRVSQTAAGFGGNADSFFPVISGDGSRIAFDSGANNFPSSGTASRDIFAADVAGGDPQFVSIIDNRFATTPSISGDGNLVSFRGTATGRAETGSPAGEDTIIQRIYVRDLTDGSLLEASTSAGGEFANAASVFSDLSADGRFVAFDSLATNLVADDANPGYDIFVKSLDGSGAIELVSATSAGTQIVGSDSRLPAMSADGTFVVFHSDGAFVGADTNGVTDVYRKNLETGVIQLVSRGADGTIGDGASLSASISDDGRFVAFRSAATNLVAGDDNGVHDIFVKDMQTGAIVRFEVEGDTSDVSPIQGVITLRPSLSGDGSTVAYATNVEIGDVGNGAGGITAGQVAVAPVDFGTPAASIAVADVLSDGPGGAGGGGGGGAGALAPLSLETLLAPDTVV
jgi:Tol biopolymer transport system component